MKDRERLYNYLMSILMLLEDNNIKEATNKLESLTNNILYDTGRY